MTVRELKPDEFDLIPDEALDNRGRLIPGMHRVAGLFDGDKLVGIWCVLMAPHIEPVWIDEEYRHRGFTRDLWGGVKAILEDMGLWAALGVIPEGTGWHEKIVDYIGAQPMPGRLFVWIKE